MYSTYRLPDYRKREQKFVKLKRKSGDTEFNLLAAKISR